MTKADFLNALAHRLGALSEIDIARSLDYYEEMIDDRMDDGMTEEEAVAAAGSPEDAALEILANIPIPQPETVPQKKKPDGRRIFLLILSSPLLIVYFSLVLCLFVALWCVPIVVWTLFVSSVAAAVGGIIAGITSFAEGAGTYGFMYLGLTLVGIGLSILFFFAAVAVTRAFARLSVHIAKGAVAPLRRKGN
ncbi:MAG: DUF1700 domain-containing protein [Clostridia bacterium]|nr:DUF1700 domain-containing protein [Clostridia bacterium]